MFIQDGQHKMICAKFPNYNREKSYIIAEAGLDKGTTFMGVFIVKIYRKGTHRFENQ